MRKRSRTLRIVPPLHRATHAVGLYLHQLRTGVTQGEAHILAQLGAEGPMTVGALHAAFGHRRSTLTSILDRLASVGYVARDVHADDRRSFLVSLTAAGRSKALEIHRALTEIESRVCAAASAADLAGFEAVVTAIQHAAAPATGAKRGRR